ncbi:MAG: hypothetical protein ABI162_01655 [Luteolibacter sp.]
MSGREKNIGDFIDWERPTAAHPISEWGSTILHLWKLGIRDFMKMPVMRVVPEVLQPDPEHRRPIGCPEAAPEGAFFSLIWYDGNDWTWGDGMLFLRDGSLKCSPLRPFVRYTGSSSQTENLESHKKRRDSEKVMLYRQILQDSPFFRSAVDALFVEVARKFEESRLADLVSAVVSWERERRLKSSGNPSSEDEYLWADFDEIHREFLNTRSHDDHEKILNDRKQSDWVEIIRFAAKRHGDQLGAKEMFKAMGGVLWEGEVRDLRDPLGSKLFNRLIQWLGNREVDLACFTTAHQRWRSKNPLPPSQQISPYRRR